MVVLYGISDTSTYAGHILPGFMVTGIGVGFIFAAAMNTATAGAERSVAGVASVLPNVAQQIGGALGPALLNTIATTSAAAFHPSGVTSKAAAVAAAQVHGYDVAITVVYVILFAAALVTGVILRGGKPAPGAVDAPLAMG